MTFHLNRFSEESADSQWSRYLQTQSHVSDIGQVVTQNRKELESTIRTASAEQQRAIGRICGTLDEGFREVNRHLSEINSNIGGLRDEINAMAAMLDWKLSLMIEEQRLTNTLLGQVARLLRVPDSQKQRVYHIEQGLKYLKNAIREGIDSAFYTDALEGFKAAEAIERKDYITLNRIGQIHLYSIRHRSFAKAEEYFLKSAREALAEDVVGGTATANDLSPHGAQTSISTAHPFRAAAAEAYLYAGRAAYLQGRLAQAASCAAQARALVQEFTEGAFEHAKYLAAGGKAGECVEVLRGVIKQDRGFALKALADGDLNTRPPVLDLLSELSETAAASTKAELELCRSLITKESSVQGVLAEAEQRFAGGSFLASMGALDVLTTPQALDYQEYKQDNDVVYVRRVTVVTKLSDFIRRESQGIKTWERLKPDLAKRTDRKARQDHLSEGGCLGALAGFVLAFFGSCHPSRLEWDGTEFLGILVALSIFGLVVGWMRYDLTDKIVAARPFGGSDAEWDKLPSIK